jgi:phosphatidylglycerophosphatase A
MQADGEEMTETPGKKPRLALAIATVFGVGYLPKAPGTWGSLVGVGVTVVSHPISWITILALLSSSGGFGIDVPMVNGRPAAWFCLLPPILIFMIVAVVGVWSSSRVCSHAGVSDPQYVVVDEVSGQGLTCLLGLIPFPLGSSVVNNPDFVGYGFLFAWRLLSWKFLILGFALFRVFDILKPWPIRRLEKLPGGWGIMADDWMAGIYAAILLRVALHFNLV